MNAGWAVGDAGTVFRLQIIGGIPSWVAQSVSGITTQNLYGQYWKDSNHGWIVGDSGTIVSTSDGGNSWSGGAGAVPPLTTVLRSVSIDTYGTGAGNGDGWAVGYDSGTLNPVFAHWDGSGWTIESVDPALATTGLGLYSVTVTGPQEGWAVGAGMSGATSLSGIFHLDPLNPPISGGGAGTTTVVFTSSSTLTSASSTETSTSTSYMTESATSTSSSISTQIVTSTSTEMSTVVSSNTLQIPGIPGFPLESILAGIIFGLVAVGVIRRIRKK